MQIRSLMMVMTSTNYCEISTLPFVTKIKAIRRSRMIFTHAKILESCINELPPSEMDETMMISLQALDGSLYDAQAEIMRLQSNITELKMAQIKIQKALGNGCDEELWPPGIYWVDAVCRCITHYSHQVIDDVHGSNS